METSTTQKIEFYNKHKHDILDERQYIRSEFNSTEGSMTIQGRIGNGTKVHNFKANYIVVNDTKIIYNYYSLCGAQTYKSRIFRVQGDVQVNCEKCLNRIKH